ncbi:hypothetical protein AAFC00_000313 [Neodothiora populina]|uniref:U3 small nucleolar RNA-associated protein 6 N-terminal domain-containing protein n=1 Tax=Neodothiora populina TaxID=2781224 RepID=A0ABR3PCG5_9PEZI
MAAAASDKARFYMEQSVPELQEYERKQIFTRAEIMSIAKKRSEFEHIVNLQPKASDYVRYAQYEMNLDALRKKRCKRTGVKATSFAGQKKVLFILERATRRFQGDMGLWMQYLEYCKKEGARKKLSDAFTKCLRLHPLKYELWIWVAKMYYEEQSDMANARNYMQRGLRFCKREKQLWLEYTKLELIYLAKLDARREILGLKKERAVEQQEEEDKTAMDTDADMLALPDVTAEELQGEKDADAEKREAELQKVAESPALSGAIPQVIFDTAMREFNNDPVLAEQFFDVFALFPTLSCTDRLLQHVLDHLAANPDRAGMSNISTSICNAKREMIGTSVRSAVDDVDEGQFPLKLAKFLSAIKKGMGSSPILNASLGERATLFLLPYLAHVGHGELDEDVEKVLKSAIKRYLRLIADAPAKIGSASGPAMFSIMADKLVKSKKVRQSEVLLDLAAEANPAWKR